MILSTEAKHQIAVQSFTSVNTVIKGAAGAIVGQVAIPVPVVHVGAVVGGFAGVIAGRILEGRGVALLICDKETDLPICTLCLWTTNKVDAPIMGQSVLCVIHTN